MRNIKEFIEGMQFDRIESYRLDGNGRIVSLIHGPEAKAIDREGRLLPNSILTPSRELHPMAEPVYASTDPVLMDHLRKLMVGGPDNRPHTTRVFYADSLLFYHGASLSGGLDIAFRSGMIRTLEGETLAISEPDFDQLRILFFAKLSHPIYGGFNYRGAEPAPWETASYPPSLIATDEGWEAGISSPIFHQNYNRIHLILETDGSHPTAAQLRRIDHVRHYPIERCQQMAAYIFDQYNAMRNDFCLPEITEEIAFNLSFYAKLTSVRIPQDPTEPIQLSFQTWDDEHGMCLGIHEDHEEIEYLY